MVDVSAKSPTLRTASARGRVVFPREVYERVRAEGSVKGDIVTVAKVAGIMGAKKTSEVLPLCHNLGLEKVRVEVEPEDITSSYNVTAYVTTGSCKTGVEMEALTAVSLACLTIYDMTKSYSHAIVIQQIALMSKAGGKSDYSHSEKGEMGN